MYLFGKLHLLRIILILIFASAQLTAFAQEAIIKAGKLYTIESEILNEERKIAVFTPDGYAEGQVTYHVMYLLDAEWNFKYVAALLDKLTAAGEIPGILLIGVVNNNRNRDLTPAGKNDNPARFGGGKKFLDFLTQELQPWVKQNYRTHPYSILAGHSFGGLFTVYTTMEEPERFQAYIALSPSLGRNGEQQVKKADAYYEQNAPIPESIYVAVGNEGGYTAISTKKYAHILQDQESGLRFKFEKLEDSSHESITIEGFIHGLKFIYEGFNLEQFPELDEIFLVEEHYKKLSERFGYELKVPESQYQRFAREQMVTKEWDYARFILSQYEKHYPGSIELVSLKADLNLLTGDFKEALKYYEMLNSLGVESESLSRIIKELKD
ncbi:alpha/beta hydrolase [Poritiphilus flavus]|uniref:Alpha/beta hydrolase n=1 Tax=Poritiphilus flavus TaxID=2697053 RepID=A0A6L9E9G5_9FLAO|nr:alpha/beta hydrolase-fold protein [Poritiphilus flavus]NAS11283.1 hypothetical protein [Poritiphilus flavus]